ncbi:hypothetical protein [Alteromonas sp. RKMC-009]|nr:hypothetical protein [Alteromonas sp. RKMC-009]
MNKDIITVAALLASIRAMLIMMEETGADHSLGLHCLIDQCEQIVSPYVK